MSHGFGLYFPEGGSSDAAMCHSPPSELWTTGIKKDLATLVTQLGSCVSKVRLRATKAPARHVGMRRHHNLLDMQTDRYSAAQQCNTTWLSTHKLGWQGM
jgi:4-diphosphocytidyl-2C-methyl-D-erythritol kinase